MGRIPDQQFSVNSTLVSSEIKEKITKTLKDSRLTNTNFRKKKGFLTNS
jgi:hypothetical protein